MTIRWKILGAAIASILLLIALMISFTANRLVRIGSDEVERFRVDALSRQITALREQVETAHSLLKPYADSGNSPEAMARAKEVVGRIRFGASGYVFAYDYDGNCLVLTTKPAWMGTNRIGEKDKLGRAYVQGIVDAGKSGGDTTRYSFDKPGTKVVADKIAYAKSFEPLRWVIGTGVYIDDIDSIVAIRQLEVRHRTRAVILSFVGLALAAMLAIAIGTGAVLRKTLVPLDVLQRRMAEVASGDADLRKRIEIVGADEVGKVSASFSGFLSTLQSTVNQVAGASKTLAATTEELSSMSAVVTIESKQLASSSGEVAKSMHEASGSMDGIAKSATTATNSVSTLAAAIEEMNASLREVAQTGQQELLCATRARDRSSEAKIAMSKLDKVIDGVGGILAAIEEIADQTKLLALNATIEAARAGEAGKGFAVVAGEVKQLAQQTASATSEIHLRIEEMRAGGQDAAIAFAGVEGAIDEVHQMSQVVGSAVEEQSATVAEIAKTVNLVDREIAAIARAVKNAANELSQSTDKLAGVDASVGRVGSSFGQMDQALRDLAKLAAELHQAVGRFRS
ncbi:MAG: hypothetical protein RL173_1083 [Fibrobacterota bacterium]|jgi:methyl-accepting chemotaxis protein